MSEIAGDNSVCAYAKDFVMTVENRILASWIGHTDIRAMAACQPKATLTRLAKIAGLPRKEEHPDGPLRTLLRQRDFEQIHLLSDFPSWVNKLYSAWVESEPTIHSVSLNDPTDYAEILGCVDPMLADITSGGTATCAELNILLSPGTPSMAAIWILLGKSKYPARFYQTHEGQCRETDIPFDLVVDLVPQLLTKSDVSFHHLVSRSPQEVEGFERIIGDSQAIRLAVGRSRKTALRDVSALLLGESGTGKELFARAIHAASSRKNGPFIAVNCAAIPRELLESELFGHVAGAFTDAKKDRDGALKKANGGILFLDEVGECDGSTQAKLLRVLEPIPGEGAAVREFTPVGADEPHRTDVRIIAATNRDLVAAIESNSFREDLYYRLASITIKLPPLRERRTDIPAIAAAILNETNRQFREQEQGFEDKHLSDSANRFVCEHTWPGNVRELRNVLVQAAVMAEREELTDADLQAALPEVPGDSREDGVFGDRLGHDFSLDQYLQSIQRHYIKVAMEQAGGVKAKAARLLGMKNYQTLDAQIKRLKVRWDE